jgi:hypothetical protein
VRGTERVLRALHRMKFEVEQFIFSSTMLLHAAAGRPTRKERKPRCFGSSARMTLRRVETAGGSWWSASGHEG